LSADEGGWSDVPRDRPPRRARATVLPFPSGGQAASGQAELPEAEAVMKSAKHCRHVKEDGIACHSPAPRGESYCHSHLRYKGHRLRTWRGRRILGVRDLHLPPPHDRGSILFSLNEVVQALAAGRLDPMRQAGSCTNWTWQARNCAKVALAAKALEAKHSSEIRRKTDRGNRAL